jgi:SLT domain-containing protein
LAGSSAGVEGWRPTVLQALARTGQSASLADIVLNQMRTESSGNTQAINNWDSNAKRGTPSKGLMQVIDPTFQTYRDRGLLNDIWNPMANIVASINYTLARYGSLSAGMRGVAYDNGGILPPGFTMAYNGTGQNEQIFTRDQMVSGGGGGVNIDLAREIANLKAAIADMPRGLNIENIHASSAGQVVAEIDHVFARCG